MTFWDGVLLSSFLWLFLCALAIIGTAIGVLGQDDLTGWSKGFTDGWDAAVRTVSDMAKSSRSEGDDLHEEEPPHTD